LLCVERGREAEPDADGDEPPAASVLPLGGGQHDSSAQLEPSGPQLMRQAVSFWD
jgi:hypothetical protein